MHTNICGLPPIAAVGSNVKRKCGKVQREINLSLFCFFQRRVVDVGVEHCLGSNFRVCFRFFHPVALHRIREDLFTSRSPLMSHYWNEHKNIFHLSSSSSCVVPLYIREVDSNMLLLLCTRRKQIPFKHFFCDFPSLKHEWGRKDGASH